MGPINQARFVYIPDSLSYKYLLYAVTLYNVTSSEKLKELVIGPLLMVVEKQKKDV